VLERGRAEIWQSWRAACADYAGHPRAKELFDRNKLPAFHDPFAGGGALPLEAQRLGLESYASDLNPVAVLINKAMIEIPPKFAGKPPVNPKSRSEKSLDPIQWHGAQGLAEDVRYYGQWMRDEAEKRIGHMYPKIEITAEMAKERTDLKPLVGQKLTVIAWLWARTVRSPNPAFAQIDVPLASTFMLCTIPGKEAFVEPMIENGGYRFTVKVGKPKDVDAAKNGTRLARANFRCLMSGSPMAGEHIKVEAKAGRMGARLMAIVAEGARGRVYLSPTPEMEAVARLAIPTWTPEGSFIEDARAFTPCIYGLKEWRQLFTPRQLLALSTFSDLVQEARDRVSRDALAAGLPDAGRGLNDRGTAYGDEVGMYLAFAIDKVADRGSSLGRWDPTPTQSGIINTFSRQALPMTWNFAEANPLGDASGNHRGAVDLVSKALLVSFTKLPGFANQEDVANQVVSADKIVSTDPPYYDNVPYSHLSDFFDVWLRRSLRSVFPDLFATVATPKAAELVAFAYRHDGKLTAEAFFLGGMTQAMHRIAEQAHPAFPVTIYYAFKQAESDADIGTASTGWDTFLDAVIRAGFAITGTWPMRTELTNRMRGMGSNVLASSIVLVCRPRATGAPTATRREFLTALEAELRIALTHLQHGNITPVDLHKPPSVQAWPSTHVMPRCSMPRANRSRCGKRWRSLIRPSMKRWPTKRATSTPTAVGP